MATYLLWINAIKPRDDKFERFHRIATDCMVMNIPVPVKVKKYFGKTADTPNDQLVLSSKGVTKRLATREIDLAAVNNCHLSNTKVVTPVVSSTDHTQDYCFDIDLVKLAEDEDIKIIRIGVTEQW